MLRAGHAVMLLTMALLTVGVVMVNSAAMSIDGQRAIAAQDVLLGRPTLLAVAAVLAMMLGARVRLDRLHRLGAHPAVLPAAVAGLVALLAAVHVPGIGHEVNGARRWVSIGPIGFQPSEIAKWAMVLVLAWYGAQRVVVMGQVRRGLLLPMVPIGMVCLLIVTEDLGTAVLIGGVGVLVLIAAGARLHHAALVAAPALASIAAAIITSPYRINRLRAFLDPWQDPQGIGYHMIQSMTAVGGGGLAGRGLGNSVQKFGYLPEDTTDFIFAIICEELGLTGAAVIVCLYAGLLLAGMSIISAARSAFERLLALGILATIGLQALMNMLVVTGLAPTKGIALPLISSGGTGWVMTAFALGLLVAMDRGAAEMPEWKDRGIEPEHALAS